MKCPICGKEVELRKKQVGTDENGAPVLNEYAVCRDCKKQWNLDKQRAKKMAAKKEAAVHKPEAEKSAASAETPVRRPGAKPEEKAAEKSAERPKESPGTERRSPADKDENSGSDAPQEKPVKKRPVQRRKPEGQEEEPRYSNIPPEKVRAEHESAVRKNYEDMLATDPNRKTPPKKKKAQTDEEEKASETPAFDKQNTDSKRRRKPEPEPEPDVEDDDIDEYYDYEPKFRVLRIILGIVSLAGFAYFIYRGFVYGMSASPNTGASGTTYIILALCMLVASMLYFILQNRNTVFAFLLPTVFYLGSGIFAFLNRGTELELLAAAIGTLILAVISLILGLVSRGDDDYDDYDDYDEDDD